ncbi:hypothetical protein ES707_21795 [subsurface metagenome]
MAEKESTRRCEVKFSGENIFTSLIVLVMALAIFEARNFILIVQVYPVLAAGATLILALSLLVTEVIRIKAGRPAEARSGTTMDITSEEEPTLAKYKGAGEVMAWILGMCLSIWLIGWLLGITTFLVAYLIFKAHSRWFVIPVLVVVMLVVLFYLDKLLEVFWPQGPLMRLLDLPIF